MKNVRFFSNKIVLVAIVVVSSLMMMSFKSTSTKKELAYSVKVEQKNLSYDQSKTPQFTGLAKWTVRGAVTAYVLVTEVCGFMDNFVSVCYTPDYLRIQEDDQAIQDEKMSKF